MNALSPSTGPAPAQSQYSTVKAGPVTPTSILLASNFARLGSGSVVAADGNVTRGTLGWRTEQGPHNATILDMVPQTEVLMDPLSA